MTLSKFTSALLLVILFSIPAVWLANYAMIFPVKSAIASWIAILMITGGYYRRWRQLKYARTNVVADDESYALILGGTALYSLYPIYIITVLIAAFYIARKQSNAAESEPGPRKESLNWLISATGLFLIDICREYTVWQEFRPRIFPAVSFIIVLLVFAYINIRQGKSEPR